MTHEAFHRVLVNPQTGQKLSAWLAEDARTDAERTDREQRARNEELYLAAIRRWFQQTDRTAPCR